MVGRLWLISMRSESQNLYMTKLRPSMGEQSSRQRKLSNISHRHPRRHTQLLLLDCWRLRVRRVINNPTRLQWDDILPMQRIASGQTWRRSLFATLSRPTPLLLTASTWPAITKVWAVLWKPRSPVAASTCLLRQQTATPAPSSISPWTSSVASWTRQKSQYVFKRA